MGRISCRYKGRKFVPFAIAPTAVQVGFLVSVVCQISESFCWTIFWTNLRRNSCKHFSEVLPKQRDCSPNFSPGRKMRAAGRPRNFGQKAGRPPQTTEKWRTNRGVRKQDGKQFNNWEHCWRAVFGGGVSWVGRFPSSSWTAGWAIVNGTDILPL